MSKAKNYIIFRLSRRMYFETGADYKWYASYYTREQLVYKLAVNYGNKYCILSNLSNDMSETTCKQVWIKNRYAFGGYDIVEQKLYFLAKIKNNSIVKLNINNIIDEVIKENIRLTKKAEKRSKRFQVERSRYGTFEFRKGPVSGIHNHKNWHRGTCYRHPKTTRSKRLNHAEYDMDLYGIETAVLGKDAKIKLLPNVYDDLVRHKDKCWKTSCKVRKQWMKHLDKHIDTM